jgi:hypothetical protein
VLAQPSVFVRVAVDLTAILGRPPIEANKYDQEEEKNGGCRVSLCGRGLAGPRLPSYTSKVAYGLCEPDIEYERELRLMQTHGAGLFEVGISGAGRIRDFEEWPGYSSS